MTTETRDFGPFVLDKKLGAGGMGVVFRGKYKKDGRILAVKILTQATNGSDRKAARFEREMKILREMRHPHIVRCYGGGKVGQQLYFALEYVPGGSFSSFLKRRGRLTWEAAVEYGLQVSSALECAHDRGIIHRDIKPENLLMTEDGKIKLADFGLARVLFEESLTATNHTVGTVAYMAPEQIQGQPPISHKTDLYALGCVLFEALTGDLPFRAGSTAEMLYAHVTKKPARVTSIALDCPIWLDTLVAQLLEKHPDDRPRDAAAVTAALMEVKEKVASGTGAFQHTVSGAPTTFHAMKQTEVAKKILPERRKRKAADVPIHERAWFLATCLLLVVAVATWAFWPASERRLFEHAEALMKSDDPAMWRSARPAIDNLLRRFPEGKYAPQAREFLDKIEMEQAESQLTLNAKFGREPESEAGRLYAEAWRYEKFGDGVTALERYRALVNLMPDPDEANRPYVNLAKRQIAAIQSDASGDQSDRQKFVLEALARAEQLYQSGAVVPANEVWSGIVSLYGSNRELRPLVEVAQARLSGKTVELPTLSSTKESDSPKSIQPPTAPVMPAADTTAPR